MEQPKLINNINELVADDLKTRLSNHSRISIAAASFSIYAFESLKKELEGIDEEEGQEEDADRKENRYQRLMNRVIRQGVKTKVLMLSATPVLPTMPRKSISTKSSSSYWIGRTMRLSRISK